MQPKDRVAKIDLIHKYIIPAHKYLRKSQKVFNKMFLYQTWLTYSFLCNISQIILQNISKNMFLYLKYFNGHFMAKHFFNPFQDKSSCLQMLFKIGFFNIRATLLKRDSIQIFSCEICEILKNIVFYRALLVTSSVKTMKFSDAFRGVKKKHWWEMG